MYQLNKTLVFFLVLTLIGSAFAFYIVVRAYDNANAFESYLTE